MSGTRRAMIATVDRGVVCWRCLWWRPSPRFYFPVEEHFLFGFRIRGTIYAYTCDDCDS